MQDLDHKTWILEKLVACPLVLSSLVFRFSLLFLMPAWGVLPFDLWESCLSGSLYKPLESPFALAESTKVDRFFSLANCFSDLADLVSRRKSRSPLRAFTPASPHLELVGWNLFSGASWGRLENFNSC